MLNHPASRRLWAVVLAVILAAIPVASAFAESTQTITATLNVALPFVNKAAVGTLVLVDSGTPEQMVENWTFTGQIDGQPASAAGVNHGKWTGSSFVGQVTEITQWNVPGVPRPSLPAPMTLSSTSVTLSDLATGPQQTSARPAPVSDTSGVVYLTFTTRSKGSFTVPLAVQGAPGLLAPFQGNLALSMTNVSSTGPVTKLPKTGAVPEWFNWLALGLVGLGGAAVLASRRALRPQSI